MKRRTMMKLSLAAGAAAVTGTGLAGCSGGGSDTLQVTLANHPWSEAIRDMVPEFEAATGLTINLTQLGEDQLSDQYNVKLNAGATDLDVLMYRPLQEGRQFSQYGYLMDLTDRVNEGDYGWDDYQAGPQSATMHEDQVLGVPLTTERECLYYRTDLLEQLGASEPPQTLDELVELSARGAADLGIAGFVARTARSAAVTQFSSYLYSHGADFHSEDGRTSTLDAPGALAAYEMYGQLIREYGPANVSTDMSWNEAMAIFTQGNALFYTEADVLFPNATDPAKSQVSDTVGFAAFPAGPAGSRPFNIPSWALAINEASQNQDNAWEFVRWATTKERTLQLQSEQGLMSARSSAWNDASGTAGFPADLTESINANSQDGVGHDRPLVIKVAQAREIVGQPIVDAITGGDVAGSVQAAHEAFQAFLDDEAE